MAAPAFVQASTGVVNTTGTPQSFGSLSGVTVGNIIIVQVLADGTGDLITMASGLTGLETLDGSTEFPYMTVIDGGGGGGDAFPVGSPTAALQHLWIGRATATTVSGSIDNNGGDDTYCRIYEFSGVHTGTALSDVIENSSAGSFANGVGTGTTISDTGVTTLGADRLALQFVTMNDDNLLNPFAGETGGDWAEAVAEFASATGTDGAIQLQTATIASAGTINGGAFTVVTDPWGVVGFALIPVASGPATSLPVEAISARRNPRRRMMQRT